MRLHRPSRRTAIILVISLSLVGLGGLYAWQSLRAWSGYEARLMSERSEYDALRSAALNGDSPKDRLAAIQRLDDKLQKRSELCQMNPLYSWQAQVIPQLKAGVKECRDKVRQLDRLVVPLRALREYLEASEKVSAILEGLNPGEALKENNWKTNGLARAKKAADELKGLTVGGDAQKLKNRAVELAQTLVKEWQDLIKANDAKDKTAFLAASAAVSKAYVGFMSLADAADQLLKQKVDAVVAEADRL